MAVAQDHWVSYNYPSNIRYFWF